VQQRHGLGQVHDVDVVALPIDEGRHLRVPALLAVTEMGARLKQLAHGKFWQSHCSVSFTGWPDARVIPAIAETPDGDGGIPDESHPRVRDGGAYTGLGSASQAPDRAETLDFPWLFKVP
jgi:hypothetical protein